MKLANFTYSLTVIHGEHATLWHLMRRPTGQDLAWECIETFRDGQLALEALSRAQDGDLRPASILPWTVDERADGTHVFDAFGGLVATLQAGAQSKRRSDAELLVRAVNFHAALVEALGDLHTASTGAYMTGRVEPLAFATAGNLLSRARGGA